MFLCLLNKLMEIKKHRPEVYSLIREESEWMIAYQVFFLTARVKIGKTFAEFNFFEINTWRIGMSALPYREPREYGVGAALQRINVFARDFGSDRLGC